MPYTSQNLVTVWYVSRGYYAASLGIHIGKDKHTTDKIAKQFFKWRRKIYYLNTFAPGDVVTI